jgi:hypothetical protein
MCQVYQWSSWKVPGSFIGITSIPHYFLNFRELISFCRSPGLILSGDLLFTASSRAWTLTSTQSSWFCSHWSWRVNWISKRSTIALPFSDGWNLRPEGPWIAVGALGPYLFRRDFSIGQIAWGVTSVLLIFVSHLSVAFLKVVRLISQPN